jgi:hypothetical protein
MTPTTPEPVIVAAVVAAVIGGIAYAVRRRQP